MRDIIRRVQSGRFSPIVDGLWLLLLALYGLVGVADAPLHGDESTLLYMGRDYYYQFVEGNWDKVFYHPEPDSLMAGGATQQMLRLLNGTIPKYVFGWAVHQAGYGIEALGDQWDWGLDWTQNMARGGVPNADVLYVARLASWVAWSLSLVGLFYLGRMVGGRRVAYVATLLLALNPAVLLHGRRAMMDSFMLLGMVMTVWAGMVAHRGGKWWQYGLLGLAGGFALASKHPSAFALVGVFGTMGLLTLVKADGRWSKLVKLVGAGLLALGLFYALNPAWWDAPIARAEEVLMMRETLLEGQVSAFGGYEDTGAKLAGWLRQSLMVVPMYYEVAGWIASPEAQMQIDAYNGQWWAGVAPGMVGGIVMAVLCLMGVWRCVTSLRRDNGGLAFIILGWAVMMLVLTLLATPLEWQRYYLPMYPVNALLAGLGVDAIISMKGATQTP